MNDLGTLPGDTYSIANAINDIGQVVGASSYFGAPWSAFLWEDGQMIELENSFGEGTGSATDINNQGFIVGIAKDLSSQEHAIIWRRGGMFDLGTFPGGTESGAMGINNKNQIVGWAIIPGVLKHAALWSDGIITDLGTLPDALDSEAFSINENGQIVGQAYALPPGGGPYTLQPVLWENDNVINLGFLPDGVGILGKAWDINNKGQIVGESGYHAFIWENGVMQDLNDLIPSGSGWLLRVGEGINDDGWITGSGLSPDGPTRGFLLIPT